MRHVTDAESDRVGVESTVGVGQLLGILPRPDQRIEAALHCPLEADVEHFLIDVGNGHLGAAFGEAKSDVAGAAGHVENRLALLGLHAADEAVLPQAVHAAGHRVVHHVILGGDAGEHCADAPRLLLGIDAFVAEGYLVAHARSSSGAAFGAPALACPRRVKMDRPMPSRMSTIPAKW